jgi:hypothetical protein
VTAQPTADASRRTPHTGSTRDGASRNGNGAGAVIAGAQRVDETGENGDRKLSALVTAATRDLSVLVRDEIALAKAEVRRDVKQAAAGSGLFGAAALFGLFAAIMLSFAAAYGIHATGLSPAWSWLIVGGAYLLIAGVAALLGLLRIKKVRGPEATKRTAGESIAVLKRPF